MHILFLTDNFPPEGNAPATRTFEHCRRWVTQGHKVTVITGAPNFPEGKVFDGYKNSWYSKSVMDGIEVRRVKTYITVNEGFAKRILDYLSFMVTSFFAGLFVSKPDVVVATSPQFFTACAGWFLSVFRRKPYVFELRDIWPASITAVGAMEKSKAIVALEKLEMFLYRRADLIVSVTNTFKEELVKRGVDGSKIVVVLNGVNLTQYSPRPKSQELLAQHELGDRFVAAYVGTHGLAHALEALVDAAQQLQHRDDIVFLFAGGGAGAEQVKKLVDEKQLGNVKVLGRQPKELMPAIWSLCDVSIVHLKDAELFRSVIPSKIFESMGMGLPLIIGVPEGEATAIVKKHQAGLVVPPEDVSAIAQAIERMADDRELRQQLAQQSHEAAKHFERDNLADSMLAELEKLAV